eukprot:TRINITY_DN38274_c0_g1_i1.p1 TRINITY_DN38274_c0_g1~~TRINITY_DN38274_c0_g1_i1.p1  ORF type:complete len:771 (+),score=77.09 TRINITY_DN38274_c0_g1_i1:79-2391(+)
MSLRRGGHLVAFLATIATYVRGASATVVATARKAAAARAPGSGIVERSDNAPINATEPSNVFQTSKSVTLQGRRSPTANSAKFGRTLRVRRSRRARRLQVRRAETSDKQGRPVSAGMPRDAGSADPTTSTVRLSWSPGVPGHCSFIRWLVEVRPAEERSDAAWSPAFGCGDLTTRDATQCVVIRLKARSRYTFRVREECEVAATRSPWAVFEALSPTKGIPSAPPENIVASDATAHSLALTWDVPNLNDCAFSRYVVEWRPCSGPPTWSVPTGCTEFPEVSVNKCTAVGLPSNTLVTFRIRTACTEANLDSGWAKRPHPATRRWSTLMQPALVPTNIVLSPHAVNGAELRWRPPQLNDCVFKAWSVQAREASSDLWVQQPACSGGVYSETSCVPRDLRCGGSFFFRIAAECTDSAVSSDAGFSEFPTTFVGLDCLVAAQVPLGVWASESSVSTVKLAWTPGAARDCSFLRWHVDVLAGNSKEWTPAQGCDKLWTRALTRCTVVGLSSNTRYTFRVREECKVERTDAPWGESNSSLLTLPAPSSPPENIVAFAATASSMKVRWDPPDFHDCVFSRYLVEWRPFEGRLAWSEAVGCSDLTSPSVRECTVRQLPPGTSVTFRVRSICTDASLDSGWPRRPHPAERQWCTLSPRATPRDGVSSGAFGVSRAQVGRVVEVATFGLADRRGLNVSSPATPYGEVSGARGFDSQTAISLGEALAYAPDMSGLWPTSSSWSSWSPPALQCGAGYSARVPKSRAVIGTPPPFFVSEAMQ